MTKLTGKDLIEMGFEPGPRIGTILKAANVPGADAQAIIDRHKKEIAAERRARHARIQPLRLRADAPHVIENIEADSDIAEKNIEKVTEDMAKLVLTPTVTEAAIMPDACPAGAIPVGCVVGARNAIHPGWHSADICCSLYATNYGKTEPKTVLDAAHAVTHFGPGGRKQGEHAPMPSDVLDAVMDDDNWFLRFWKLRDTARSHLMTQGDGNHFAFVGRSEATGDTWLVTHHGSRGFGALLYKLGMKVAEDCRKEICPELDKGHAWIPFDTDNGKEYWHALQVVRQWTKANHALIHSAVEQRTRALAIGSFWNEHNFVFKDGDVFWHAKGATPVHDLFLPDTDGIQIVPLNMTQPVLFVKGKRNAANLGFAPHGAGRNWSRTAHRKQATGLVDEIVARETEGYDVRFWCGKPDITELPSAYKDAESVQDQMKWFNLAETVDRIMPYGAIMAGDWESDAPWRKKAEAKREAAR